MRTFRRQFNINQYRCENLLSRSLKYVVEMHRNNWEKTRNPCVHYSACSRNRPWYGPNDSLRHNCVYVSLRDASFSVIVFCLVLGVSKQVLLKSLTKYTSGTNIKLPILSQYYNLVQNYNYKQQQKTRNTIKINTLKAIAKH